MARMAAIPLQREPEIEYPTSDGKPMGETGLHVRVILYLYQALTERFAGVPDVLVSANNFFYYEEGNPKAVICPDVHVVKGVPSEPPRDHYLLWREGKVPCLVVEVTSKSTRREDLKKKRDLYAKLGIPEYFLFDPREEYLKPPLQGFRLLKGEYRSIPPAADGSVTSRTAGVIFHPEGDWVRLADAATGEPLLTAEEWREKARATEERIRQLEEEIERLRRQSGS